MFTTIEILDPKVFYRGRPIQFKRDGLEWTYALVSYLEHERVKIIWVLGNNTNPETEYLRYEDIKSGKVEIKFLGEEKC